VYTTPTTTDEDPETTAQVTCFRTSTCAVGWCQLLIKRVGCHGASESFHTRKRVSHGGKGETLVPPYMYAVASLSYGDRGWSLVPPHKRGRASLLLIVLKAVLKCLISAIETHGNSCIMNRFQVKLSSSTRLNMFQLCPSTFNVCPYSAFVPGLADTAMSPVPGTAPSESINCVIAANDAKAKHTAAVAHVTELTKFSVEQAGGYPISTT